MHADPELSFHEERTARFISECLAAEGIEHRPTAGTGILARLVGNGDPRRAVVLRADIDALPVREETNAAWKSRNDGIMHACGHDIHAAVLFGVLQRLKHEGGFRGTIFGLFQPAEECNPGGASFVLAENPFDGYEVTAVIGEHVEAGLAVGTLGFCSGKFMASNDELRFTVRGKGGHAAMRSVLKDPVIAAADLVLRLAELNSRECVVSTGRIIADGATNVIPDEVHIEGTMRTFDEEVRRRAKRSIADIAAQTDSRYGVETETDIGEGYPCVVNDERLTATARELAAERFRAVDLQPRTTSEDFGRYCERYPSLFYRLGAGERSGATHTSMFDPDERAIDTGIEFMSLLAIKLSETYE